jgi:hypothetical protein
MAKKGLCIGINDYPGVGSDLGGCVNDANDFKSALEARGFTVDQLLNDKATARAIDQAMTRLVAGARPGDSIVVTFSCHGSWVPDENADEGDGADEILCPYDIAAGNYISDDRIYEIVQSLAPGARMLIVTDACHSGTMLKRLPDELVGFKRERSDPTEPRPRFLAPSAFLPPDKLARATARALTRTFSAPRPFGGLLLAACQDTESAFDAAFAGRANGVFSYYALRALSELPREATYQQLYDEIRQSLPTRGYPQTPNLLGSEAQKAWQVLEPQGEAEALPVGGPAAAHQPDCPEKPVEAAPVASAGNAGNSGSRSPWSWGDASRRSAVQASPAARASKPSGSNGGNEMGTVAQSAVGTGIARVRWVEDPPQSRRSSPPAQGGSTLAEGQLVTVTNDYDALYKVEGGQLHRLFPNQAEEMGITQNEIMEVDSSVFLTMSVAQTRSRAIGRDLQKYLSSGPRQLGSGHRMQSWVWLQGTTLKVRTITEAYTWFGGWTGGVRIHLFDANQMPLEHEPLHWAYGQDGRAFSDGIRDKWQTVQLPQHVANAAEDILIVHAWEPKVDLLQLAIQVGLKLWELYEKYRQMQHWNYPINSGGDWF